MSEPLDLAMRALRDAGGVEADAPAVAATRARVLARASEARRRRRRVLRLLLPIAAVLVLSTAWASTRGLTAASWLGKRSAADATQVEARATGGPAVVASPPALAVPTASAAPAPSDDVAPPIPVVPVEQLAPAQPPASAPRAAPRAAVRAPAAAAPTAAPAATDDPAAAQDVALYAAAHRAHFVDHDWAAALHAWDAYLAAEPGGRFVLEARYNRAIALVRLGRTAEARRALEPFARGPSGGYRAQEARDILDALDRRATP